MPRYPWVGWVFFILQSRFSSCLPSLNRPAAKGIPENIYKCFISIKGVSIYPTIHILDRFKFEYVVGYVRSRLHL